MLNVGVFLSLTLPHAIQSTKCFLKRTEQPQESLPLPEDTERAHKVRITKRVIFCILFPSPGIFTQSLH